MQGNEHNPETRQVGNLDSASFEQLLNLARKGDHDALALLLERHRNYLLLIANDKIDNRIQGKIGSSDIVQESLITAQQKFGDFNGDAPAQLKAWLRQIVTNDVYQSARHFKGTAKRQVDRERPIQYGSSIQNPLIDQNHTPRTNAVQQEESRKLESAMAELPDDYREVIRLRNWDQLSFHEIGEAMNRSEDAARKIWTRAIVRLQELIEGQ